MNAGIEAQSGQFPFHVAIYRDQIYRCAGSLISSKAVLTVGHCVVSINNKELLAIDIFRLFFGAVDLKSLTGDEALREVSKIVLHPDFDYVTILKQDIAIVIIKGNLQFSSKIRAICLPDNQQEPTTVINQKATVLGFGSTEQSKNPSRHLSFGLMTLITRQQCIESNLVFGLLPEKSAFCAKGVENMIACPGDSGGKKIFYLKY